MSRFTDTVVVILGGGADGPAHESGQMPMGNGRAIAMRLASEGATVVVVDRNRALAEVTLDACGGKGIAIEADLANVEQCKSIVAQAHDAYGRIDVIVSNAAIDSSMSVLNQTVEDWELANDVNVRGHWLVAQAALPHMIEKGHGVFVFVGSTAGALSPGRSLAYEATKAAQMAVMRHIAVRFGRKGIRSNAVVLGVIDSALVRREFGAEPEALKARDSLAPLGRQGRPEEVAAAAAFLASDDASYVNGHSLVVDGGVSAQWPSPRRG
jgi:NAD(P)-dependent dehydrogenase (short-subunit alcohol dehydrogenase family)